VHCTIPEYKLDLQTKKQVAFLYSLIAQFTVINSTLPVTTTIWDPPTDPLYMKFCGEDDNNTKPTTEQTLTYCTLEDEIQF